MWNAFSRFRMFCFVNKVLYYIVNVIWLVLHTTLILTLACLRFQPNLIWLRQQYHYIGYTYWSILCVYTVYISMAYEVTKRGRSFECDRVNRRWNMYGAVKKLVYTKQRRKYYNNYFVYDLKVDIAEFRDEMNAL